MRCADCSPHVCHFGRCMAMYGADGKLAPACECKTEEPPMSSYVPTAAERGYAGDDAHDLWIDTGSGGSSWLRDLEDRRERPAIS